MAANFYTLQETAEKLGIDEEKVKNLVRDRKLREYRDGSKRLYKTDDVDGLVGQLDELGGGEETVDITADSDESIGLAPLDDESDKGESDSVEDEELMLVSDDEFSEADAGAEDESEDSDESGELGLDMDLEVDDDFAAALELDGDDDKPVPEDGPMKDTGDDLTFEDSGEDKDGDESGEAETQEEDDEIEFSAVDNESDADEQKDSEKAKSEQEEQKAKNQEAGAEEQEIGLIGMEAEEESEPEEKEPVGSGAEDSEENKSDLSGQIELEDENIDDADVNLDSVDGTNINLADLTSADTNVGTTGVNVLSDTDDGFKLSDDSLSETRAMDSGEQSSSGGLGLGDEGSDDSGIDEELGDLDDDLNMDSVGSGSGLLDLSLQADDTSLGAVLDDILPGGDEGGVAGAADIEADLSRDMAMEDEEGEVSEDETLPGGFDQQIGGGVAVGGPQGGGFSARQVAQPIDETSGAFGVSLLVPLAALIIALVAVSAGLRGVEPSILKMLSKPLWGLNVIWYVVIAMIFAVLLVVMIGSAMAGSEGGGRSKKAKKRKKEKKKAKRKK